MLRNYQLQAVLEFLDVVELSVEILDQLFLILVLALFQQYPVDLFYDTADGLNFVDVVFVGEDARAANSEPAFGERAEEFDLFVFVGFADRELCGF